MLNEKFSVGLNYRSAVKVKVENGTADFSSAQTVRQYFQDSTFNTQLNLPFMASIGLGYHLNNKVKIALDINYVGWKSYDSLNIDFAKNSDKLADVASPRLYKNTFIFSCWFVVVSLIDTSAYPVYSVMTFKHFKMF